jgi:hypothetical protein
MSKLGLSELREMIRDEMRTVESVISHRRPDKVKAEEDLWAGGKNLVQPLNRSLELDDYLSLDCEPVEDAWGGGENLVRPSDWRKLKKMLEACGCGGEPDEEQQGERTDVDVDWQHPEYGGFTGNIEDLESQEAFSLGFSMGVSGDFDDVMEDSGGFSDLENTNIDKDEAFSAGESVCNIEHDDADPYSRMREEGSYWHGPSCESEIPDMGSYQSVVDVLTQHPEMVVRMVEPMMQATGASCPVSTTRAISDVMDVYNQNES